MAKRKRSEGIAADALLKRRVAKTRWVVPGILPIGLSVCGGRPKTGKSWLSMGLGVAVSTGTEFLGKIPVDRGGVAYLALEDNLSRLKSRLTKVLHEREPPTDLFFHCEWPTLDQGGLDQLAAWLHEHRETRLVIIDTLARIRGTTRRRGDVYHADYEVMAGLKSFADRHRISMLLVHHLRKAAASDHFDQFSGSAGITGAADALLHLSRPRGEDEAVLRITGRDVEEHEIALRFQPTRGAFDVTGDARAIFLSPERREILAYVTNCDEPVGPKVVAEALSMPYGSVRRSMSEMAKKQRVLRRVRRGYVASDTGVTPVTGVTTDTDFGFSLAGCCTSPSLFSDTEDPDDPITH